MKELFHATTISCHMLLSEAVKAHRIIYRPIISPVASIPLWD